ncbi:hypothetical protein C8Q77DRAFT_1164898 [Trametes polyzona]|nr:hypothetical protein C8Q77DRAFT_1164898 [Trametes polyzona]
MAPEIRFNSIGIPYLVEFANVAFRSRPRSSSRASSRTVASSTLASERTLTSTASSATLTNPGPCPGPEPEFPEEHGLYIRFASQLAQPPSRLSETRLARLKYRIAKAVLAAGMDSSPAAELGDPMDAGAAGRGRGRGRVSISSIRSENVERDGLPGSLFRGTYGQVMTALRAAGLATVPCKESGVQDATRLGALFVAHPNERGGVDFTRLTLWA